jgi:hypothetical protein
MAASNVTRFDAFDIVGAVGSAASQNCVHRAGTNRSTHRAARQNNIKNHRKKLRGFLVGSEECASPLQE